MFYLTTGFVLALALFYAVAGLVPLLRMEASGARYVQWGYPPWFPYVTAALEVLVALLLPWTQTRFAGAVLGIVIMVAAIATVLRSKEYSHALPPAIVMVLTALAGITV